MRSSKGEPADQGEPPPEKQAAAIKAEPKANAMEEDAAEEVPIDGQIAELDGSIKSLKGAKDGTKAKAVCEAWEAELKLLKEQRKRARPRTA